MKSTATKDRVCLTLCVLSLICYLLASEPLRAFGREVSRLLGKL